MCLIVDANVAHLVFGQPRSDAAAPIWRWLRDGGILVYGGRLAIELTKTREVRRLLLELGRRGSAVLISTDAVDDEERAVTLLGLCESDDPHIIGLARVSGARVLFTHDQDLMIDFRNRQLVRPKGRIYQRKQHAALLSHWRGCRGRRS